MHKFKGIKVLLLACAMTAAISLTAAAQSAVVTASGSLNMRSGPGTSYRVIASAPTGATVEVLDGADGFYKVSYKGLEGYMSAQYLKLQEESGVVTASSLRVRSTPVSGDVVGNLSKGTQVTIKDTDSKTGWYKITAGSLTGWCSHEYIEKAGSTSGSEGEQIVAEAMKYLGVKYSYGGSSPSTGFDCSGFTSYVFKQMGYSISRRASTQYADGTAVSKADLRPGDLVFFSNSSSGGSIGHVGIYVGNNSYIHSQSYSVPVTVTSLSTSWSQRHYIGACRIIGG